MSNRPESESNETQSRRRLVAWPLSLAALTVALLLVTQVAASVGRGFHGRMDLDELKERADSVVEHLLDEVEATDDQHARIQAIVDTGLDELAAAHGPRDEGPSEWGALFTAEVVDLDAMEALRRQHVERADEMSEIAGRHIGEILEVLTHEQRLELHARFERHRDEHGRGHRWH